MTYIVHDIFHTIQGEGANLGRAAVFVRFAGCNLWSGREKDRGTAVCQFCDTDFRKGAPHSRLELVTRIRAFPGAELIVFTGGEPALQLDQELVDELHGQFGYQVAIETNGTRAIPKVQWTCVSPKAGTDIVVSEADELKLVYPQGPRLTPEDALRAVSAKHRWLSPMDGPEWAENVRTAIDYIKQDNRWRLNIQAHKFWGIA
ncbi:MAG TPA: 7-carboxy-7-deazaguanine synthase [Sphingomicrobium sp.]|nr:7-carboxy-7-deazaguanine synthase [Sphingomicrobium sp.]